MSHYQRCPNGDVYLNIHQFKSSFSDRELYRIGRLYCCSSFVRYDVRTGYLIPFCQTHDGQNVLYDPANNYHFLRRKDLNTGLRYVDMTRLQRLRWIRPIIEGKTKLIFLFKEKTDSETGIKKRLYYCRSLKYLVVLNQKNEGTWLLNTAYRVTEDWMRQKIEEDFK